MAEAEMPRGLFFVIEGIDGCGKTTQADLLGKFLQSRGHQVRRVQDPGTTEAGKEMRKLLLNKDIALSPKAQMLLFTAARAELADVIREYQVAGIHVVSDRWFLSTLAYQGFMSGLSGEELKPLKDLHRTFVNLRPDVCIHLDLSATEAEARMRAGGRNADRFEAKPIEWRERLVGAYIEAAHAHGHVRSISGKPPVADVQYALLWHAADECHAFANMLARQVIVDTRDGV